jgi:hypothetical protein
MLIELRTPEERLRGDKAVDVAPVLSAVLGAARQADGADLARLRVVCEWLQYRHNFRDPVVRRLIEPGELEEAQASRSAEAPDTDRPAWEIAIDLRRATSQIDGLDQALAEVLGTPPGQSGRVALEDWCPGSRSCIWGFNALYWKALSHWEQSTGRGYESALPGGESDARNVSAARELIERLFGIWDGLAVRRALPEELYVVELGVGNGNQARVFLDTFLQLDRETGRDYYRRLHYFMGDYSPHVLELARAAVAHHSEHISSLVLNATRPAETLGFLRYKAFLVYISNVYDNLPTDEVVRIGGRLYRVEVRAALSRSEAERFAGGLGIEVGELRDVVSKLLRLGPELLAEMLPEQFPSVSEAVTLWREVWEALRLDERYVPLEELDTYSVAHGVGGELLWPIVQSNGDLRMHVSNGAAASFADTLPLLHPLGVLLCHDLFVTDIHQYLTGFRGPGKYDGSVVNWVNGPLLSAIGTRRGFDVTFTPFVYRTSSNVLTLTARARD